MPDFYIDNHITASTFQSFAHFAEKLKRQNNLQINLYIDENDMLVYDKPAQLEVVLAFRNMLREYMNKHHFIINVYAKRLRNAGIIILMTVPPENVYLSKYISAKYSLQMSSNNNDTYEKYAIKEIEESVNYVDDRQFIRIIEVLVLNTNLTYETVEKYADKDLNLKELQNLGFGQNTFEPFLSIQEIGIFSDEIAYSKKIPYHFPLKINQQIQMAIDNYNKGYLSRYDLYQKVFKILSDHIL